MSVIQLGPHERMSVEQVLAYVQHEDWSHVIVVGYHNNDDSIVVRSSNMSREFALWIAEQLKLHSLGMKSCQ